MVQQPPGQPPGGAQPPPPPPPPGQPPQAPSGPPRAQFDTSKLPIPDIVVAVGALFAWIFALTSWYSVEFGFGFGGVSGRGNFQWLPWATFFFLMCFAGFFILNSFLNFVEIDIPLGIIYLIWAIVGTVFTLLAFVVRPGDWDYVKMNWPLWIIAIICSIAAIVGGVLKVQES